VCYSLTAEMEISQLNQVCTSSSKDENSSYVKENPQGTPSYKIVGPRGEFSTVGNEKARFLDLSTYSLHTTHIETKPECLH
jgi:hypothetical protein